MPSLLLINFNNYPAWWLLLCLLVGLLYAVFLYKISELKSKPLQVFLFGFRWVFISLLCVLLLNPLIGQVHKRVEKPIIIIAQDNSTSIPLSAAKNFNKPQYETALRQLQASLASMYQVKVYHFGDKVNDGFDFNYTAQQTNFSQLFETIKTDYEAKNIGAIIVASDGIINQGANPSDEGIMPKSPVYTIALGDTIAKKDVLIADVKYNPLVYLGNQHQIIVSVAAKQAKGKSTLLNVLSSDGQKFSTAIIIDRNDFYKTYTFNLNTTKKGIQKIAVSLKNIGNEVSLSNNAQNVFVEVIDEKQKILIYANAPHPDISALKQALQSNKSYVVNTQFEGESISNVGKYDLVVLYQIPSINGSANAILKQVAHIPHLYILGAGSNLNAFNNAQNVISVSGQGQLNDVSPAINTAFAGFALSDNVKNDIAQWPVLLSPVNAISSLSGTALLNNRTSGQPLFIYATSAEIKTAVLLGEGIWRWRFNDFKQHGNFLRFDELINKTIRYLTASQSRKNFWATPSHTQFAENESVHLDAGLYNEALEPTNEPDVRLEIKSNTNKKYSFLFSRSNNQYQLDAGYMPAGEYSFTASTSLGAKKYTAIGQFMVSPNMAEYSQTKANHQLLYNLSAVTGGKMLYPHQIKTLEKLLENSSQIKTIIHEDEQYESLINLKWLFFILLALLSTEWFLRKRNGLV
ncbi:MAG: hypothetical protein EAZ51_04180 [Sphingobacteriales bacterium]|nr:MAG: hypothetical protein EAZ64_08205 [Sphingobacteriales bacterium]TAF81472.1 MAG: hypothetical protein EAZ51_04180 [Sphingobacteriales bacterium]